MNRQRVFSILWIAELVIGLFPITMLLSASMVSYFFLLKIVPQLIHKSDAAAVRSFLSVTGMVLGGTSGLIGIALALPRPEDLRHRPGRMLTSIIFGCTGVLAEVLYLSQEGLRAIASSFFTIWALSGPLIIGLHCLYRCATRKPHLST